MFKKFTYNDNNIKEISLCNRYDDFEDDWRDNTWDEDIDYESENDNDDSWDNNYCVDNIFSNSNNMESYFRLLETVKEQARNKKESEAKNFFEKALQKEKRDEKKIQELKPKIKPESSDFFTEKATSKRSVFILKDKS
jgi:hypothetical protein